MHSNKWSSFISCSAAEPTRVIVPPLSSDASVGQSLVLPCEVSSDSSLSPVFKWFFNGKAIDFSRQEHFEIIGAVRKHLWWKVWKICKDFQRYSFLWNSPCCQPPIIEFTYILCCICCGPTLTIFCCIALWKSFEIYLYRCCTCIDLIPSPLFLFC